jgi:hypothetical protein
MKNQYTLHNDYIRCIDLPKVSSSIICNDKHWPIFSIYTDITPQIIIVYKIKKLSFNSHHGEERAFSFKGEKSIDQ